MKNVKINEWKLACICAEASGILLNCSCLNDVDFGLQRQIKDIGYILSTIGEYHCHMDCGDKKAAMASYFHTLKMWELYKRDYR